MVRISLSIYIKHQNGFSLIHQQTGRRVQIQMLPSGVWSLCELEHHKVKLVCRVSYQLTVISMKIKILPHKQFSQQIL